MMKYHGESVTDLDPAQIMESLKLDGAGRGSSSEWPDILLSVQQRMKYAPG